jgi:hypothetical protein
VTAAPSSAAAGAGPAVVGVALPDPPLPLRVAAEVSPANEWCERWGPDRRPSWRHRHEGGFDKSRYHVDEIEEDPAATFVTTYHYSGAWVAARRRYGLFDGPQLVGVAVLSVPMHPAVLTNVFPDLQVVEAAELGRLVLFDAVPANAESWFLARVFRRAAKTGLRGIVSFADPVARRDATGRIVFPGHIGVTYLAHNAVPLGRSRARWETVLPDGRVLPDRTQAKVVAGHRGKDYAIEGLRRLGAPPPRPGESGRAWLDRALPQIGASRQRHGGKWRYAWVIGPETERRAARIALPRTPRPTQPDPVEDLEAA